MISLEITVEQFRRFPPKPSIDKQPLGWPFEWEHVEDLARQGVASVAAFQKLVDQVSHKIVGEGLPSQTAREYFSEWLICAVHFRRINRRENEGYPKDLKGLSSELVWI